MKIAIIGGGNMGGAIAKGVARAGVVPASSIVVTARTSQTLSEITASNPAIRTTTDNCEAIQGADLILLAVKPWLLEQVIEQIKPLLDPSYQQVASVVAGVSFAQLHALLDSDGQPPCVLYRIIPNTAISQAQSVTFIASQGASALQLRHVEELFAPLGLTLVVDEEQMTGGTSLASCGIAFALKYLDAAIGGGVELGFTPEQARTVVMQTMCGALEMLRANGTMPQTEIDRVTTPGGITLKGLAAMDAAGFAEAVLAGLRKSR